jgi:hypothetical protein
MKEDEPKPIITIEALVKAMKEGIEKGKTDGAKIAQCVQVAVKYYEDMKNTYK